MAVCFWSFWLSATYITLHTHAATYRTDDYSEILKSKEGSWGSWSGFTYCDEGQYGNTIQFRSESSQGALDDVAGVAVRLICEEPGSSTEHTYEIDSSQPGKGWGSWYGMTDKKSPSSEACPSGHWLTGFRTKVQSACSSFLCVQDDTALNCINMKCSDNTILEPLDCRGSGSWGNWDECTQGYICGFQEKFEEDEAVDDETGLNAVQFKCCDFTDAPTASPTPSPTPSPSPSPTPAPTTSPTRSPTKAPSPVPSRTPSEGPTIEPTADTAAPSTSPSPAPTESPVTPFPSQRPSEEPTMSPQTDGDIGAGGAQSVVNNNNTTHVDLTPLWIIMACTLACCVCGCIGVLLYWIRKKYDRQLHSVDAQSLPIDVDEEDDGLSLVEGTAATAGGTAHVTPEGRKLSEIDAGPPDTAGGVPLGEEEDEDLLPRESVVGENMKLDVDGDDDDSDEDIAPYAS